MTAAKSAPAVSRPEGGAIRVTVNVDSDELREWAGRHADAGRSGVAEVLFRAARDIEAGTYPTDPPREPEPVMEPLPDNADIDAAIEAGAEAMGPLYWPEPHEFVQEYAERQARAVIAAALPHLHRAEQDGDTGTAEGDKGSMMSNPDAVQRGVGPMMTDPRGEQGGVTNEAS